MLKSLLQFVDRIADRNYQKRVWERVEGPECDDFDETMVYFFDESEPILRDYKKFGISDSQHQLLLKMRDALDVFSDEMMYLPAEKIIYDPRWGEIQDMAKDVLKAFSYPLKAS